MNIVELLEDIREKKTKAESMTDQGSYNAAYLYGFVDGANKALCSEMHALFADP